MLAQKFLLTSFFVFAASLGNISCGDIHSSNSEVKYEIHDKWVRGDLEFVRVTHRAPSNAGVISLTIQRPDSTWRVVSGGGEVKYVGAGIMLTSSYPLDSSGTAWRVEAKAHQVMDSGNLEGAAIFARKKNGTRIADSDYLVTSSRTGLALIPNASVSLPSGFTLVSGGALLEDNLTGGGQLLTASYPEGNTWIAQSKAHFIPSEKRLRAYIIGLKSSFLDESNVEIRSNFSERTGSLPEAECTTPQGYDVIGGGALVEEGEIAPGILLTASTPVGQNVWKASAKAHLQPDNKNLRVYCIGVGAK